MGVQSCIPLSRLGLWQGEDRDSSDEEWSSAYAALDPMSRIGWGNRSVQVNGGAAEMVRDAFLAADVMHEEAMSAMDGNEEDDQEIEQNGADVAQAGEPIATEGCLEAECSADGSSQGEGGGCMANPLSV